jgi:hypothetical protein
MFTSNARAPCGGRPLRQFTGSFAGTKFRTISGDGLRDSPRASQRPMTTEREIDHRLHTVSRPILAIARCQPERAGHRTDVHGKHSKKVCG